MVSSAEVVSGVRLSGATECRNEVHGTTATGAPVNIGGGCNVEVDVGGGPSNEAEGSGGAADIDEVFIVPVISREQIGAGGTTTAAKAATGNPGGGTAVLGRTGGGGAANGNVGATGVAAADGADDAAIDGATEDEHTCGWMALVFGGGLVGTNGSGGGPLNGGIITGGAETAVTNVTVGGTAIAAAVLTMTCGGGAGGRTTGGGGGGVGRTQGGGGTGTFVGPGPLSVGLAFSWASAGGVLGAGGGGGRTCSHVSTLLSLSMSISTGGDDICIGLCGRRATAAHSSFASGDAFELKNNDQYYACNVEIV